MKQRAGLIFWQIVSGIAMVATVLLIIFLTLDLLPGDAATLRLGVEADPARLAELRAQYGLDQPLMNRFTSWLAKVLQGDLGNSVVTGQPVATMIQGPLIRTMVLFACALLTTVVLGVGIGLLAGYRAGSRFDRLFSGSAIAVVCTPEFVIATLVVLVFAGWLELLPAVSLVPVGGSVFDQPTIIILPALSIAIAGSAALFRQVRAVTMRVAAKPHVESAILSGLPTSTVITSHVVPSVASPVSQAVASLVPYLVGGTVIVEQVFSYPGLGTILVSAVSNREPEVLMACTLIIVGTAVVAYRLADLLGDRPTP